MDQELEILKQIKMVDAPPFLLTRISQRIENRKNNTLSQKLTYAFSIAFTLLLAVNMLLIFKHAKQEYDPTNLISSMNILEDHSIYK